MTAIAWYLLPWCALLGAGAALGALLLARVQQVRWVLASLGSFGRALAPILVPLVAVAAYASSYYPRTVQLAAGAVTAALVWYLLVGQGRIANERAEAAQLTPLLLAAPAVVLIVFFAMRLRGPEPALIVGLFALAAVAVLRLGGYATSATRWVVVALFSLLVLRFATVVGLVPPLFGVGGPVFWASVLMLVSLLVGALAVEGFQLQGSDAPLPSAFKRKLRARGLVISFVAAIALLSGMIAARKETTTGTTGFDRAYHATVPVKLTKVGGSRELELAWTYAPMLRLHPDEVYLPASADDYLAHTALVKCTNRGARRDCRRRSCPECADEAYSSNAGAHPHGVVFYARVARERELAAWPREPGEKELEILIQYWIFYDYDRWRARTTVGDLIQKHDADWEFVSVGLESETKPLFVALSAHCGGQLVAWNSDLAVLEGTAHKDGTVTIQRPRPGLGERPPSERATHPLVAVANGSHGNYADNSGHRPPDWGSCVHKPLEALGPLVYAANVRDETAARDDDLRLMQPRAIELVDRDTPPVAQTERWGSETIGFKHREWRDRPGPLSPPAQRQSWSNVLRSFLCDRYWTRDKAFARAASAAC